VVFVNPRICLGLYPGICHVICHEIYLAGKNIKKIMVSQNFCQTHLLEVGLTQIPIDHAPLSIVRHVGIHVDFHQQTFFRPLGLHLLV
jgi:hypothetical protein